MASGAWRRNIAEFADDTSMDVESIAREGIRIGGPETDEVFERIIRRMRSMRTRTTGAAAAITQIRRLAGSSDLWLPPDDPPINRDAA